MNLKSTIAAAALCLCATSTPVFAWERETVGKGIETMCEGISPDDWPAQTRCIEVQWDALRSFSPIQVGEYGAAYSLCKDEAGNEFNFLRIKACYEAAATDVSQRAEIAEAKELFETGKIVVRCKFGDKNVVGTGLNDKVAFKVDGENPVIGKRKGYLFSWGGALREDYTIQGDSLANLSTNKMTMTVGKCERFD